MKKIEWLEDCELCNTGVCKRIGELKETGMSERAASRQMEQDCDGLWSADKILNRYKYHAKQQFGGGGTPTRAKNFTDQVFDLQVRLKAIHALTVDCAFECVNGDAGEACRGRMLKHTDNEFYEIYDTSVLFHACLRDKNMEYSKRLLRHEGQTLKRYAKIITGTTN